MLLAALAVGRDTRARLRDATRQRTEVRFCSLQEELRPLVVGSIVGAVVTEPWDAVGVPVAPTIRTIRAEFPSLPIVVYCPLNAVTAREIVRLIKAGADDVLVRGGDDESSVLGRLLADAQTARISAEVMEMMAPFLRSEAASILAYCLEHATQPLTVARIARDLGVHRKTLVNRLAAERLPVPSVLVAWCRLLLAARLLEDESRPVEQVALALDFGSGTALRNMLRRYTGLRPSEVRALGGLMCVVEHFRLALAGAHLPIDH